jgi:hypothetical protein
MARASDEPQLSQGPCRTNLAFLVLSEILWLPQVLARKSETLKAGPVVSPNLKPAGLAEPFGSDLF